MKDFLIDTAVAIISFLFTLFEYFMYALFAYIYLGMLVLILFIVWAMLKLGFRKLTGSKKKELI